MGKLQNPKIMTAAKFKANCMAIIDEVARTKQSVVITKNGKPIADLTPHRSEKQNALGVCKGSLTIVGDIMSPIDVEWDAMK